MLRPRSMAPEGRTDAELVGDTLAGNRGAFAEIVGRYQTLVCSLAYSATGDLARSEDLAQDTFLAVWRQLPELREPEKLRAWICGIIRNQIRQSYRGANREPTFKAETLEYAGEVAASEAQPSDQAASQDETAIMWRALERIPETYREPLILFHRENQSVERVAAALDLTEDAVKQRLVRGRKLLQAEVEAVVEGALRRTAPGQAFTSSVMEALPAGATVVKAAGLAGGAAAAKGAAGGGIGMILGLIVTSPVTPLFIVYLMRKLGQDLVTKVGVAAGADARWAEERTLRKGQLRVYTGVVLAMIVTLEALKLWIRHTLRLPWHAPLLLLVPTAALIFIIVREMRVRWKIRRLWADTETDSERLIFEFRSRQELRGRPLLHVLLGATNNPATGWIAVGNVAYGWILACGTIAVAPISFGVFGLGFVGFGAFVAGGLSLGILPVGVLACGILPVGWMVMGMFAFGIRAAFGFAAYAVTFADFPAHHGKMTMAFAQHAHDSVAQEFFHQSWFFSSLREVEGLVRDHHIIFIEAVVLLIMPIVLVARLRRLPFRRR